MSDEESKLDWDNLFNLTPTEAVDATMDYFGTFVDDEGDVSLDNIYSALESMDVRDAYTQVLLAIHVFLKYADPEHFEGNKVVQEITSALKERSNESEDDVLSSYLQS